MKTFPGVAQIAVVLVEDEDDLRDELVIALADRGFDVRGFPASRELYRGLIDRPCDIAILDIGLPGEDGFSIMAHLRATFRLGVIMLTARHRIDDRVKALHAGADVYLVKPVDIDELAANVMSLARRLYPPFLPEGPSSKAGMGATQKTGWRLAEDDWQLLTPEDEAVALSPGERAMLRLLLAEVGTVVSRDDLSRILGYQGEDRFSNRIDMAVSRLRRKVREKTGASLPLRAMRGRGFVLMAAGTREAVDP